MCDRVPGPLCGEQRGRDWIDDGTMGRSRTSSPGQTGRRLTPSAEIVNFAILFELATTRDTLTTGRFDNRSFAFTSPRLARSAELLAFVVGAIANERRGGQINQAVAIWRSIESDIREILVQAGKQGAPLDEPRAGFARLQEALYSEQAEELVRTGERNADLAMPDAGLYAEQDRLLGQTFQALAAAIREGEGVFQWNTRNIYRMTTAGGAGASEGMVRYQNYLRTAIGWAAVWQDTKTIGERLAKAKREGLIEVGATAANFVSRGTTTVIDTTNAFIAIWKNSLKLQATSLAQQMAAAAASVNTGQSFGNAAAAEFKLEKVNKYLNKFEGLKFLSKLSGGLQVVAGVASLIKAIKDDNLRAGVAAGHSTIQGGITLGSAIMGSSTAAATFLSGSVTAVWVTIEAIFDIAELSAWGRRQKKIAEIAAILQGAARLIPTGKRMAGVADAFAQIDAADSSERFAMEQRLTALGAEPFAVVLRGLLAIKTEVGRRPEWAPVMGAEAGQALVELARYENWPSDAVSPDVIGNVSAIAKPIFLGLRRVGDWAIAKYGEANQTDAGRARVRALEAGEAVPLPK